MILAHAAAAKSIRNAVGGKRIRGERCSNDLKEPYQDLCLMRLFSFITVMLLN